MRYRNKAFRLSIVMAAVLLLGSVPGRAAPPIQDGDPGTIGACLAQPDGTRITLAGEQVVWRGKSGKSFAIKEWFERRAGEPRLVAVSTGQISP